MSLFTELKAWIHPDGPLHSETPSCSSFNAAFFHALQKKERRDRCSAADKPSHPWWLKPDDIHLQSRREGDVMHIWCFYPPYKHSLYRMNETHTAWTFLMCDFPKSDLRLKTERGLEGGEVGRDSVARDSEITHFKWWVFGKMCKHDLSRDTDHLHFWHLYIVSESLSEEFVSPVILLTVTETDFSVLLCSWHLLHQIVAGDDAKIHD